MVLSAIGRAAIEAREGNRLTAYKDSVGVWTIGVGVTTASGLITVTPGLTITQAQSDALFDRAAAKYVDPVRKALAKPVPQPFFDACVSLAYNIGPVGFAHSSVCRLANAGDLPGAVEAFLMWNKPAAIISRRQGERDQAALPSYAAGAVYARRGDWAPVKAPAGAGATNPPIAATKPPIVATAPSPVLPATNPPAPKPAPTGGLSSAPRPAPAAAPVAKPGLFAGILGRLQAAYPPAKKV